MTKQIVIKLWTHQNTGEERFYINNIDVPWGVKVWFSSKGMIEGACGLQFTSDRSVPVTRNRIETEVYPQLKSAFVDKDFTDLETIRQIAGA